MSAMPKRSTPWPAGVPCWVDLTVPDVPAAQAFYSTVLGWTFPDLDRDHGGYVVARVDGAAVAGIGPTLQVGIPAAWTVCLAAPDADATAQAIGAHGGTVLLPPGEVGDLGRLCVAADPTGAVFGVWQAGAQIGVERYSEPGALAWEDLRSPDPDAARAFYTAVFGYETRALAAAGPGYTTFHTPGDDAPLGGMGGMFWTEVPPHWLAYFGAVDVDAALARAVAAGGSQPMPAHDSPFGRMGTVLDPFGAAFTVAQTDPATAYDRGD